MLGGMSAQDIARDMVIPRKVVSDHLNQPRAKHLPDLLSRNGRTLGAGQAAYGRESQETPVDDVRGTKMSIKEIKELKNELGVTKMPARTRPKDVTPEQAAARFKWCKDKRSWTADQWRNVMWSGESCAERGGNKRQ